MRALDHKPHIMPALVQIGGQSVTNLVRHALDSRKARWERYRDLVRDHQQMARDQCARGEGCTITEPVQDPLFEEAA